MDQSQKEPAQDHSGQQQQPRTSHNDSGDDQPSCSETPTRPPHETDARQTNSLVEYFGRGTNSCGYCKRDETESAGRQSYDMRAYRLRPADYQLMLDRGWRRSGRYCYHPINDTTCCPNYAISCKTTRFKLSKSQRRCIENLNSFLVNGSPRDRLRLNYGAISGPSNMSQHPAFPDRKQFELLKNSPKARTRRFVSSCERKMKIHGLGIDEAIKATKLKNLQRRQSKSQWPEASLEDYLFPTRPCLKDGQKSTNALSQPKHKLEIHMYYVGSDTSQALRVKEHEVMQRYQREIHQEDPEEWSMSRFCDFLAGSPLIVEPIDPKDYDYLDKGTTCETLSVDACREAPRDYLIVKPPELPTSYGTYHCSYHLDGELIAVGVLDVLPKSITSVYFFYDPAYGFLNLGIYSALVEIAMVRQIASRFIGRYPLIENERLIHYYMGFYVHECQKMHYKTKFKPSYLLCSQSCEWIPTDTCLEKLVDRKFARFSTNPDTILQNIYQETPPYSIISLIPVENPVVDSNSILDYIGWLKVNLGHEYVTIFLYNLLVPYSRVVGVKLIPRLTLRVNAIHRALVKRHRQLASRSGEPGADDHQSNSDSES